MKKQSIAWASLLKGSSVQHERAVCKYCLKKFSTNRYRRQHHNKAHPSKPFDYGETPPVHKPKPICSTPPSKRTKSSYSTCSVEKMLNHLDQYKSLPTDGSKKKYLQSKEINVRKLRRWKKKENKLRKTPHKRTRSNVNDTPEQASNKGENSHEEQVLYDEIIQKRTSGSKVSRKWIVLRMKQLLKIPPADKTRVTTGWLKGFLKRKKLSNQKIRNNKRHTVYQRIHKVFNYHWYVVYKAQDELPEDPRNFEESAQD